MLGKARFTLCLALVLQISVSHQVVRAMGAAAQPPNGKVVFSRLIGSLVVPTNNPKLFMVNPSSRYDLFLFETNNKSKVARLTDKPKFGVVCLFPHFSPDGKSVLFKGDNYGADGGGIDQKASNTDYAVDIPLRVMSSSTRRYVTLPKADSDCDSVSWSPDGRFICVSVPTRSMMHQTNQPDKIYIYDVKTGRNRKIVSMPEGISDVFWSPDSRTIFFEYANLRKWKMNSESDMPIPSLYSVPRTGGRPKLIIKGKERRYGYSLSPNNRQMAYIQGHDLYIARADGNGAAIAVKLERNHPVNDYPEPVRPVWTRTGDKLVFAEVLGNRPTSPMSLPTYRTTLHVFDLTSHKAKPIRTVDQRVSGVAWSKDGRWLILKAYLYGDNDKGRDLMTGSYTYSREGLVAVSVDDGRIVTLKEPNEETSGIDWIETD